VGRAAPDGVALAATGGKIPQPKEIRMRAPAFIVLGPGDPAPAFLPPGVTPARAYWQKPDPS